MIKCNDWPIAVCTWSMGNDFDKIGALREQTQLNHLHLAVSPALSEDGKNYLSRVQKEGWDITAAMIDFAHEDYSSLESIKATGGIVPDDCWEDNKKRVIEAIEVTEQLGVKYLTFHFGFLDQTDVKYVRKFAEKTKLLADAAANKQVMLLMETGQEAAGELRGFLEELNHPALGVNFDPANMILYDKGNPIEAVGTLAPWIKHIHIKDAVLTQTKGTWGQEIAWGTGQVGSDEFLKALKQINFSGALTVEREAGDDRLVDIKSAISKLTDY